MPTPFGDVLGQREFMGDLQISADILKCEPMFPTRKNLDVIQKLLLAPFAERTQATICSKKAGRGGKQQSRKQSMLLPSMKIVKKFSANFCNNFKAVMNKSPNFVFRRQIVQIIPRNLVSVSAAAVVHMHSSNSKVVTRSHLFSTLSNGSILTEYFQSSLSHSLSQGYWFLLEIYTLSSMFSHYGILNNISDAQGDDGIALLTSFI
uniref:Uncharacterized protein n=1 Tax=Glossina austeni TaxID=7395 RepID=A0A1A9UGS8_GLOAU